MKKITYLLFALLFAAACSNEGGGNNPPEPPQPEEMTFEVDIQTTSRQIDIKVTPSDNTKYYCATYMVRELYDGLGFAGNPEYFKEYWALYLSDYITEESDLSQFLNKGESSQTFTGKNAMPETDYVACIFGIEPDLTFTTEIKTVPFSTKEREGTWVDGVTFEISCMQTSSFGAVLNYKVSGPDVTWLSFVDFKEKFDLDFKGSAEAFVTYERNRFDQILSSSTQDWTNHLRPAKDFDETWNNMGPDTEYVAVAVGISTDGKLITEPSEPFFFRTKKEGTGVDIVEDTEHFRFHITNLTTQRCQWAVEPLAEPGQYEYMYAETMPKEAYPDLTGLEDIAQFNAFLSEIFDREVCRAFWDSPSQEKYLQAYSSYYQKSFMTDLDGQPLLLSFQEWAGDGYDVTKPFVVMAFPIEPQLDFDWTTWDWDNYVTPQSTYGAVEFIEFTAPQPEPDPEALALPADADPADRMHYYRLANK